MMTPDSHADVIVIGAGVSGLLAAARCATASSRVVVFDKGRGVGGRLATRRTDSGVFDHGAQFFTARDPNSVCWSKRGRRRESSGPGPLVLRWPTAPSSAMAKRVSAASPE